VLRKMFPGFKFVNGCHSETKAFVGCVSSFKRVSQRDTPNGFIKVSRTEIKER